MRIQPIRTYNPPLSKTTAYKIESTTIDSRNSKVTVDTIDYNEDGCEETISIRNGRDLVITNKNYNPHRLEIVGGTVKSVDLKAKGAKATFIDCKFSPFYKIPEIDKKKPSTRKGVGENVVPWLKTCGSVVYIKGDVYGKIDCSQIDKIHPEKTNKVKRDYVHIIGNNYAEIHLDPADEVYIDGKNYGKIVNEPWVY